MLDQHNQLLLAYKPLETRVVAIVWISWNDAWTTTLPSDILCLGKHILHKMLLARELNLNMALAQSTTTASSAIDLEAVDGINGLIETDKLDIAVKSLAGNTLHDDVDWLTIILTDDAGIATKEGKNLLTVNRVRDLQSFQQDSDLFGSGEDLRC